MMNADILTKVNFTQLLDFHLKLILQLLCVLEITLTKFHMSCKNKSLN